MWKRDESDKPESPVPRAGPARTATRASASAGAATSASPRPVGRDVVNIGKSVVIKGELSGSEDLTIEGTVNGQIELREHVLTIGRNGRIKATIFAKSVAVMGHVVGNISATDKINIWENGRVEGDLHAPKIAIAEGAQFRGRIEMDRQAAPRASQPRKVTAAAKPAAAPTEAPAARIAH